MRMRSKPWAKPELDACPFFVRTPEEQKGRWHEWFPEKRPVHLELGCGKGYFIAGLAPAHPELNYIGVDLKDVVLAPAKRIVEAAFDGRPVANVALTGHDIERLREIMDERDRVERIYINFCNPWPKPRHWKRRLTYPTRLDDYRLLLPDNGEIWFKTDDDPLFRDTLRYFEAAGYEVYWMTQHLHADPIDDEITVMTEHERMFSEQGIPIKAAKARVRPRGEKKASE